jgi:phospholipase C
METKRRKDFFFAKKKQKTCATWLRTFRRGSAQESKVFWFFFSKKNMLALLLAATANAATAEAHVFKHIIVVIQENRTPDNLFGSNPKFEPDVDIARQGKTSTGRIVPLRAEALDNCYDISHTHMAFEDAYTRGFDTEPYITQTGCKVPPFPQYGYVDNSTGTVQPYFDIAVANGFANRMFQTNQGPSFPAHQFLFGGTSAPLPSTTLFAAENPSGNDGAGCIAGDAALVALINPAGSESAHAPIYPCFEHQTLADLLDAAPKPIGWRYYSAGDNSIWTAPNAIRHLCLPAIVSHARACTGPDWVQNVVPDNPAQVLSDIGACDLQPVSWVIPTGEESDHASINNGSGPSWVASIVNAVGNAATCGGESYWDDTAIFITWDDWGGWFDHVAPFKVPQPYKWGAGYTYGFRVPLLVVSAYTKPGQVSNAIFDFGSILAFIEKNFKLGFIGPGTSILTQYADYQATLSGRGDLKSFFTLPAPKKFSTIASPLGIRDFLNAPKSVVGPDND